MLGAFSLGAQVPHEDGAGGSLAGRDAAGPRDGLVLHCTASPAARVPFLPSTFPQTPSQTTDTAGSCRAVLSRMREEGAVSTSTPVLKNNGYRFLAEFACTREAVFCDISTPRGVVHRSARK